MIKDFIGRQTMKNLVQIIRSTFFKRIDANVSYSSHDKDSGLTRVFVNNGTNTTFLLNYRPEDHKPISVEVKRRPGLPFRHHAHYKYGPARVYNQKKGSYT